MSIGLRVVISITFNLATTLKPQNSSDFEQLKIALKTAPASFPTYPTLQQQQLQHLDKLTKMGSKVLQ